MLVFQMARLSANAVFGTIPTIGTPVLMLGIICFAYSTILGWSYYGERVTLYLFGRRWVPLYIGLYYLYGIPRRHWCRRYRLDGN